MIDRLTRGTWRTPVHSSGLSGGIHAAPGEAWMSNTSCGVSWHAEVPPPSRESAATDTGFALDKRHVNFDLFQCAFLSGRRCLSLSGYATDPRPTVSGSLPSSHQHLDRQNPAGAWQRFQDWKTGESASKGCVASLKIPGIQRLLWEQHGRTGAGGSLVVTRDSHKCVLPFFTSKGCTQQKM